ncbi:MAG: asparagine synthase-related protein, partial [Acidobacteriota bacterium]
MLLAYEKWGHEFPGRLVGDFALAIWDPKAQRLLLARDPFGIRTLFYSAGDDEVLFSSTLDSMLRSGAAELTLDEDFIADYLTTTSFSNKTPFRQIKAVPPGVTLCFDPDRQSQEEYWRLDPGQEISYGSDGEYEEHFRELFFDAVRSRLPDSGPVFSELSGGLDSSSIVCVADAILRQEGQSADRLQTLSYVFEEAPSSDERGYIRCVEEHVGRQGIHLSEVDTPLLAPIPESTLLPFPSPDHLFSRRQTAAREAMDQAGARVLLRGTAGDHVAWGEVVQPFELADHLSRGHFGAFFKSLRSWSKSLRVPYLQLGWNAGLLPLLPPKLQKYSARTLDQKPASFFHPDFVRRYNLAGRMLGAEAAEGSSLPSRRQHHQLIQDAAEQVSWGFFLESGAVETTYPFLHRPLVEFCMAIDMRQKLRPGETRSILRRSLRGVLPETVRKRQSKRGPDEAILRALAQRSD